MALSNVNKRKVPKVDFSWAIIKQLWDILPTPKKRAAIKLWVLMLGSMLLEMLSVGLVVPILTVLTKPELLSYFPDVNQFFLNDAGEVNQQTLVLCSMALLFIVYLTKTVYLSFFSLQQSRFVYGLQASLAQQLFTTYLRQSYTFHLQQNSAFLIRNVQAEMNILINSAINPTMLLLAEGLVVIGLFSLMFYFEPLGTLVVFGFISFVGFILQTATKNRIADWGRNRLFHEGHRTKHLHQGIAGAKDVMLLGREADFINQYKEHTEQSMKMSRRQYVMQQMPRLWLELLAIVGLCVFVSAMVLRGYSVVEVLPTITLFLAVSFRLMPSANRIINALQQLRFGLPSVVLLHEELSLPQANHHDQLVVKQPLKSDIKLQNVSYAYPGTSKMVLNAVNVEINKGEMVGLIGESGSGKSTIVDVLLGLLPASDGHLLIDGVNVADNLRRWQDQIGYVPQSIYLTDDTLRKNIAFGLAEEDIDDAAVMRAIKSAQLETFVSNLAEGVNTVVGERGIRFSGGQSQRIGIARALYHEPAVLILDEATSALDTATEEGVMDAVNSLKAEKTILLVTHRLSTLRFCDSIYKIEGGQCEKVDSPYRAGQGS